MPLDIIESYRRKDLRYERVKWKESFETPWQKELRRRQELEQSMRRAQHAHQANARLARSRTIRDGKALVREALKAQSAWQAAARSIRSRTIRDEKALILEALNNKKFEWRTVPGIAEETGIAPERVETLLKAPGDDIVRSSRFTTDGRSLYATRSRYEEFTPTWRKILGVVKNEVD